MAPNVTDLSTLSWSVEGAIAQLQKPLQKSVSLSKLLDRFEQFVAAAFGKGLLVLDEPHQAVYGWGQVSHALLE